MLTQSSRMLSVSNVQFVVGSVTPGVNKYHVRQVSSSWDTLEPPTLVQMMKKSGEVVVEVWFLQVHTSIRIVYFSWLRWNGTTPAPNVTHCLAGQFHTKIAFTAEQRAAIYRVI